MAEGSPTSRFRSSSTANRGNKARMSMKTNSREVEESRSFDARSRGQARRCLRVVTLRLSTLDSQLLDSNSTEQSDNVYENKERGKKVERSRAVSGIDPPLTRLATLATLSPRERAFDRVRLLQPSLTNREKRAKMQKSGEQSENVYENKGQVQNVAESCHAGPNAGRTFPGRKRRGGYGSSSAESSPTRMPCAHPWACA